MEICGDVLRVVGMVEIAGSIWTMARALTYVVGELTRRDNFAAKPFSLISRNNSRQKNILKCDLTVRSIQDKQKAAVQDGGRTTNEEAGPA